ncbi:MBL fold metallo-hydrolase [Streptomyces sp. HNM0574]|uniref:MBL fold metallo-hydrolase n=1 Tax=Streptomyces sp. HNM0574 TaxID=2714954 RepID=UPI001469F6B4|nr:MBL fold metallo-hydrolase [Streptomyces sp. HNM0574]NLU68332.1 MBL fold metallo-hydrolase [Streptomyces sp. HNM0574]
MSATARATNHTPAHTPGIPTWEVGNIAVHRIDETSLPPATGPWLLPEATGEVVTQHPWLSPDFADEQGVPRLASHSFALTTGGLRVLVDTGIGNGKPRANPAWNDLNTDYLDRLTQAGFPPESVDLVILTHLHTDHVGWNTRKSGGTWEPTFPRARYLTSRTEWDFWAGYAMDEPRRQMFRDSVDPVRAAGLLDLVDVAENGTDVAPGLRLLPTPGHTPGHLAVGLRDDDATALITGDCVHHPVQLPHPGIGSCVDIDPVQAEATRRSLIRSLADTETLVLGTHFPPPTAGRLRTHGTTHRLAPVPPELRTERL